MIKFIFLNILINVLVLQIIKCFQKSILDKDRSSISFNYFNVRFEVKILLLENLLFSFRLDSILGLKLFLV